MIDNWWLICATKWVLYTVYNHSKHSLTYGRDQTKKRKRDITFTTCIEVDIEQTIECFKANFILLEQISQLLLSMKDQTFNCPIQEFVNSEQEK